MSADRFLSKRETIVLVLLALVVLVLMPCLNAFLPKTSPFYVTDFTLTVYGKYLCYSVLTLGVDLLWGYTGLLSLGQSLFFALGGYALGMHLLLMIGKLGQYHNDLPDFMVFLEYKRLPPHWVPFYHFWFAAAAVVWVPGAVAAIFGFLAFRSRIKGVYFSILSQALTYAACLMFFRNDFTFGGNNGMTDFKFILGHDLRASATQRGLFIASGLLLFGSYLLCRWLTHTRFGKVQQAIRDSENRVLFSGYATANFKLFVFVLAAVLAGLGDALFVPQAGIINPSEMAPDKSLEAVVWVAVGGRGTLLGPILGAVGVNMLKSYATRAFPNSWYYLLGGMFIFVVLFMPKGLVGLPRQLQDLWQKFRPRSQTNPVPAEEDADKVGRARPAEPGTPAPPPPRDETVNGTGSL